MRAVSKMSFTLNKGEAEQAVAEAVKGQLPAGYKVKSVHFKIEEVGGDCMDRFPGVDTVTGVTVECEKE